LLLQRTLHDLGRHRTPGILLNPRAALTRAKDFAKAIEKDGLQAGRAAIAGDCRAWCDPIYGRQDGM
jgi:hypothetical protein